MRAGHSSSRPAAAVEYVGAEGTVSYIYMTSDGGAKLQDYYDLVPHLASHVNVVSANKLIAMAVQKHQHEAS